MTRRLFILFLWFGSTYTGYAQAQPHVMRLGPGDDLGAVEWRFKAGDDTTWASPMLVDSTWELVAPNRSNRKTEALWRAGRGWFRLTVVLSPKIVNQDTYLSIRQFGQSAIYLDGKRLATLKPMNIDSGGSQRLVMMVPLRFADTNRHVVAIRYAFHKSPTLFAETGRPALSMHFGLAEHVMQEAGLTELFPGIISTVLCSVWSLLALLLFRFYRSNRTQVVYRLLGWSMLLMAMSGFVFVITYSSSSLTILSVSDLVSELMSTTGLSFFLLAVYRYLRMPFGWPLYGVLLIQFGGFIYSLAIGPIPTLATAGILLTYGADYIRISWLGKQTGQPDARLPWQSLKVAFFTLLSVIPVTIIGVVVALTLSKLGVQLPSSKEFVFVVLSAIMLIAILSIPIGLSLSLVRDYAQTHETLGEKQREVQVLLAQSLAQEQEKQQLLAQQNEQLEQQVRDRTAALNQSLIELRTTQKQLVQREKLASLGELTAGVAHEIQNPLNFVNNFAEVSAELIDEIQVEQTKPPTERDEALSHELLADLANNVGKIKLHGQRAASIVHGMLQHSRPSSAERTSSDLNAVVDEYLRLAYHGLRAKNNAFNATLNLCLAPDLPMLPVVVPDLGRVLINLFNNAFYAVHQRATTGEDPAYKPTVTVTTSQLTGSLGIVIEDNGTGMTADVVTKIFQPFFTTKPTGQGTGLGLSISYDIITQGHGGTLSVETEAGQYARFQITLPTGASH